MCGGGGTYIGEKIKKFTFYPLFLLSSSNNYINKACWYGRGHFAFTIGTTKASPAIISVLEGGVGLK